MTTRLTFNPNENYEQAGLLVYGDDANYVKADYVYANNRGLEFLREANNVAAGFGGFVNINTQPTTVDMRITSDGTTLRAYYRFEGGGWTPYGEPATAGERAEPEGRHLRQRQQRHGDVARRRGVRLLPDHPGAARHHGADLHRNPGRRHVQRSGRRHADCHGRGIGRRADRVPPRRRRVDGLHGSGDDQRRRRAHARAPRHRRGGQRECGRVRHVHDRGRPDGRAGDRGVRRPVDGLGAAATSASRSTASIPTAARSATAGRSATARCSGRRSTGRSPSRACTR